MAKVMIGYLLFSVLMVHTRSQENATDVGGVPNFNDPDIDFGPQSGQGNVDLQDSIFDIGDPESRIVNGTEEASAAQREIGLIGSAEDFEGSDFGSQGLIGADASGQKALEVRGLGTQDGVAPEGVFKYHKKEQGDLGRVTGGSGSIGEILGSTKSDAGIVNNGSVGVPVQGEVESRVEPEIKGTPVSKLNVTSTTEGPGIYSRVRPHWTYGLYRHDSELKGDSKVHRPVSNGHVSNIHVFETGSGLKGVPGIPVPFRGDGPVRTEVNHGWPVFTGRPVYDHHENFIPHGGGPQPFHNCGPRLWQVHNYDVAHRQGGPRWLSGRFGPQKYWDV